MRAIWQDVRYAVRGFLRTPAFCIVSILILTVALGAVTTMFSLLYALSLRPVLVSDPNSLVQIATQVFPFLEIPN